MAEAATTGKSGKVVIRNVGLMLSGDIDRPLLDADTVVVVDGVITAVGREKDCDTAEPATLIDAMGTTLCPGLIDSHVHPVFGDWTPRQSQLGWIDSTMHGGVTCMVSAGEVHLPGRPKDVVGLKALAITAQRAFDNFRPGGVKVIAGAPIIERGMVENDFAELAAKVRTSDAQAVLYIGSSGSVASGVKALRTAGLTVQVVTLSNNASEGFIKLLAEHARGVIVTQVFPNERAVNYRLIKEAQELARAKGLGGVSPAMVEGFAAAKVLVEGLRRAGPKPTPSGLRDALEGLHKFDLGGLDVSYTADDHSGLDFADLSIIGSDGKFMR